MFIIINYFFNGGSLSEIAGKFEQKSSRLIEAHVCIVSCNIYLDFKNIPKEKEHIMHAHYTDDHNNNIFPI